MTENISRQRTETSDFARASCRIFCGMLRRIGYSVAGTHERVLTAVFEALREASLEGSVCVGRSRFESVYRRLFAEPATLTEALGVLRLFDCVRVHGDAPSGDQRAALPFVADVATVEGGSQEAVRLYSERSFVAELRLAQKIWALADIDGKNAVQAADEIEAGPGTDAIIRRALSHRFSVVSGGPGTGKTTAVVKVLHALLQLNPEAVIVLAAPTGKAAGRMQQAVVSGAERLGTGGMIEKLRCLRAQTIHRLLATPLPDGSMPGAATPLTCDILVVDESSMIDSDLAMRLFDAVDGRRTRVILLGDRFQLAAVGPGSVFSDLSDQNSVLAPIITQLTVSHRFSAEKAVGRIAAAVNRGRAGRVQELLEAYTEHPEPQDNSVCWHREARPEKSALTPQARAWLSEMARGMVEAVRGAVSDCGGDFRKAAGAVAACYARYGVLCAHRRGPMSVDAVNRYVDECLSAAGFEGSAWRQIIIRKNDPYLGLYNGDIGLVLPSDVPGAESVYFADASGSEGGRLVRLALLPEFDAAFAVTIHQSQGSEYARVAVLMPPEAASGLATRELLYTAVTRVRDERGAAGEKLYGRLDIFCSKEVLTAGVSRSVRREGALAERLCELAAGA